MYPLSQQTRIYLADAVGRAEAPWAPIRRGQWHRAPAVYAARRGESVRNWGSAGGVRKRKATQRIRDELREHCLLEGDFFPTRHARAFVRGSAYPFCFKDLARILNRFNDCILKKRFRIADYGKLFVPEVHVCGAKNPSSLATLQWAMTPFLVEGIILARSSPHGRVYYGADGRIEDVLDAVAICYIDGLEFDEKLCTTLNESYAQARQQIMSDSTYYHELGEVPQAPWSELENGRDPEDPRGMRNLFPSERTAID